MSDNHWLADQFNQRRDRLLAAAFRMLGSSAEAEDAVQEAWLKLSRADICDVQNLGGWLTTVVARVCLDMLRTRKSRREEPLTLTENNAAVELTEPETMLADAIGPALLVVLDMLAPAERVAFVLHDMFDLRFEEIAAIVGRTPAAARQLASRARRRVRGAPAPTDGIEPHRDVVTAFLAASREGDFQHLISVLSPNVVMRADELAVRTSAQRTQQGAPSLAPEVRGASCVADVFKGRARGAVPVMIDGEPGAVWAMGEHVRAAFLFSFEGGKIAAIDLVMHPLDLAELSVEFL
ncbi:MAG TPA: sigma-70 family RNA polymerase sigma factor [Kofleriaceae bacterium]|nr:sigma-70 family RNA polymerase sigma factor [Kofleriaceae bacterium]